MEFGSFEGTCKYCGFILPIMAADQKDADIKVGEGCDCGGYLREKRFINAKVLVDKYFGDACIEAGLRTVDVDVLPLLYKAVECVNSEKIKSVSIAITPSTKCAISMNAKESIRVERTDTHKFQGGA